MREGFYDPLEVVYAGLDAEGRAREVCTAGEHGLLGEWAARRGYVRVAALTYPLPAALAESVAARLGKRCAADGCPARPLTALASLARRELRRLGLPGRFRLEDGGGEGEGYPTVQVREAVRAAVAGKRLLAAEVGRAAACRGFFPEELTRALTALRLEGQLESVAAVGREADGVWRCRRCGSTRIQQAPCANCGDSACPACVDCELLGDARACRRLYFAPGGTLRQSAGREGPPGGAPGGPRAFSLPALTPGQRRAAAGLVEWVKAGGSPPEALLWAVCGAGKTAVVRPALETALAQGWEVLYCSPRRQVIAAVAAQLPRRGLVLSTIHQALRYQEAFDLIVVDEPDAYPYRGNRLLARGLARAARPQARWLHLTATPEPELLARAEAGGVLLVLLPERFHGRPLPVPRLVVPGAGLEGPAGGQGIAALAAEIIKARSGDERRRFLVFVPTVPLGQAVRSALVTSLGWPVAAVASGSPDRDGTIAAFRQGLFRVLVSTTVLERGVTFPFLDVLVLHADHRLFDRVSLVQMAGRAGRTAEDPEGEVWFLAGEVSPEMAAAARLVEAMNRAAG